jgi:hypothetical protein
MVSSLLTEPKIVERYLDVKAEIIIKKSLGPKNTEPILSGVEEI